MAVITNAGLLVRRINELQRRRKGLAEQQDSMRRSLPEWAVAPLQLVGMSGEEIRSFIGDLSRVESDAGLDDIERELEALDEEVEELELTLTETASPTFEGVRALLDLAVERLRNQTVTDPRDVFYDYGDARVLTMLEQAAAGLHTLTAPAQRQASGAAA